MNRNLFIIFLICLLVISFPASAAEENENLYSNKAFRNPFIKFKEDVKEEENKIDEEKKEESPSKENKVYKLEEVISEMPFSLKGIIKSNNKNLALIDSSSGTDFVEKYYQKDDYVITQINKTNIIIFSRGFRFRMIVGGEIDGI